MFQTWGKRFVWSAFLLASLIGGPTRVLAAGSDTGPLADVILGSFPYELAAGTQAMAGNDWCLQVETDPAVNWWAFQPTKDGGQMAFNATRDAFRIKLIFHSAKDSGNYAFASIFVALDTINGQQHSYQGGTLTKLTTSTNPPHAEKAKIVLPNNVPPGCMTLAQFLTPFLGVGVNFQDAPSCSVDTDDTSQGGCGTYETTSGVKIRTKLVATATENANHVFWNFNGRAHEIAGAFRILVTVPIAGAASVPAYLTIGYGGNGGPG